MRIATWNVNSVNARLETVVRWFEEARPDVACLQEIKCVDEKFPAEAFERLGYNVAVHGQKTYNGVALLSKAPLEDVRRGLPHLPGSAEDADDHARYIEAVVSGPDPVRVASIYLPNGNPVPPEKFAYKLAWLARLNARARTRQRQRPPLPAGPPGPAAGVTWRRTGPQRHRDRETSHVRRVWTGLASSGRRRAGR